MLLGEYVEAQMDDGFIAHRSTFHADDAGTVNPEMVASSEKFHFAKMVEAKIRKAIPTWSTTKPSATGKTSKEIKQPENKQKVTGGTVTLTTGMKRLVPSNGYGQILLVDAALAELEAAGIRGGYLPHENSFLDSSINKLVDEFIESRKPKAAEPAAEPAPAAAS